MAFYVLYYIEVKDGEDDNFRKAWRLLASDTQSAWKDSGSTLFQTESGMYTCLAKWPSHDVWKKYWTHKEKMLPSYKSFSAFLKRPLQAIVLDPIVSNFHNMEHLSHLNITQVN